MIFKVETREGVQQNAYIVPFPPNHTVDDFLSMTNRTIERKEFRMNSVGPLVVFGRKIGPDPWIFYWVEAHSLLNACEIASYLTGAGQ